MKFNLVEYLDETRDIIQEYMWDAVDELNNAPLDTYIKWFKNNLTAYPTDIEQAVTDAYIEAVDYGLIKGVEKTKLTSYLKDFLEAHEHLLDDKDALIAACPGHLQHELKIVLSKLNESLNEELLTEARPPKHIIYEARFDTEAATDAIEIFCDDYDKFKQLVDKYARRIKNFKLIRIHLLKLRKQDYCFPDIQPSFTILDSNQLDSNIPRSFRKSSEENSITTSKGTVKRLLNIWNNFHDTDGVKEFVDSDHAKITFN